MEHSGEVRENKRKQTNPGFAIRAQCYKTFYGRNLQMNFLKVCTSRGKSYKTFCGRNLRMNFLKVSPG